jgi:hypothetical protein
MDHSVCFLGDDNMPRASLKQRKDGRCKCKYKGAQFYGETQFEAFAKRDIYKKQLGSGFRVETDGIAFSRCARKWIDSYKGNASTRYYNDLLAPGNSVKKKTKGSKRGSNA